ncbi:LOW QUALITY PROTEIN: protein peste-like [Glossina fuscipes fuscipes]
MKYAATVREKEEFELYDIDGEVFRDLTFYPITAIEEGYLRLLTGYAMARRENAPKLNHAPKILTLQDTNINRYKKEFLELAVIRVGQFGKVYQYLNRLHGCIYAIKKSIKPVADSSFEKRALNQNFFHFTQYFHRKSNKKPHFVELGSYRCVEKVDKVDIVWHTNNHSVSYRKKSVFNFDPENSKGSLSDKITSVNVVAHSIALKSKDDSIFQKMLVARTLKIYNAGVSITKTADQWLFTGYVDPFLSLGNLLSKFNKDVKIPYDRVGYLYTRNNSATYDGHFNVFTGADDIRKMGEIHTSNYKKHSRIFEVECGQVTGSMGEFFPPILRPQDTLWLFVPNICRAVPFDYMESVQIHNVNAHKYSLGERLLDNGTLFPSNKCFCIGGKCECSGVFNIGPCAYNAWMYISLPHFYKADPYYLDAIEGLKPEKEKHEFFMTVEPNLGVPMDVGGGLQGNYLLEPIEYLPSFLLFCSYFRPFDGVQRAFMPLMWGEQRVRVPPEMAEGIGLVPLIILIGHIFTGTLLALGLICWYPAKSITSNYLCSKQKRATSNTNMKTTSLPRKSSSDLENTDLLQKNKIIILGS